VGSSETVGNINTNCVLTNSGVGEFVFVGTGVQVGTGVSDGLGVSEGIGVCVLVGMTTVGGMTTGGYGLMPDCGKKKIHPYTRRISIVPPARIRVRIFHFFSGSLSSSGGIS